MKASEFRSPWEGSTPDRAMIEAVWSAVIAGTLPREVAHVWSIPWVEGDHRVDDIWVATAMQYLHGCDMVIADPGRPTVVRHGGLGQYYKTLERIAEELINWKNDVEQSERDPKDFRARKDAELRLTLAREMPPEQVELVMARVHAWRQRTTRD